MSLVMTPPAVSIPVERGATSRRRTMCRASTRLGHGEEEDSPRERKPQDNLIRVMVIPSGFIAGRYVRVWQSRAACAKQQRAEPEISSNQTSRPNRISRSFSFISSYLDWAI